MDTISFKKVPESLPTFLEHCERTTAKARQSVVRAGETADTLYYVIHGTLEIVLEDEAGRQLIISYLNDGDFFGEMGLFDGESSRSAGITAKTNAEIASISYQRFMEIRGTFPDIIETLAAQMARRLRKTTNKVGDLAFMDVSGRIARSLMDLCEQPDAMSHPQGMQIRITRQDIGKIVGCSREMAGRVLKNLEEQGLIEAHGKTIIIYGTR